MSGCETPGNLPGPIAVGTSADLKVGQAAFAIGNPLRPRSVADDWRDQRLKAAPVDERRREIGNVFQTDAAVNPGNSGGPLLDSAGRLIGVTTAIISPSGSNAGIGFAVPVDTVNRVVPELIKNGRVPTPGIGIVAANEAVATRLGIEGVVVVPCCCPVRPPRKRDCAASSQAGELGDVIVARTGNPPGACQI